MSVSFVFSLFWWNLDVALPQLNSSIFTWLTSNNTFQCSYARSRFYRWCFNPKICLQSVVMLSWRLNFRHYFESLTPRLSKNSSASLREYKATRSNIWNSCWSRRKLLLYRLVFTGDGVGVGIVGGGVRALRTLLKSKIGIASWDISLTEAESEESGRFTKMTTVNHRSNQQNKNSKHSAQFWADSFAAI